MDKKKMKLREKQQWSGQNFHGEGHNVKVMS